MSQRKFTFEKGKLYIATIVLKGLQKLAGSDTVASRVTEALGMRVNARKIKPGEFLVSGIWQSATREVVLPPEVFAVKECG